MSATSPTAGSYPAVETHINPCPKPNIPPLRIELSDIPVPSSHPQYFRAVFAVRGYWKQACNMSLADQREYKHLLSTKAFLFSGLDATGSEHHRVFKAYEQQQTWARYIWLESIYHRSIAPVIAIGFKAHGSLMVEDLTEDYRKHHPTPETKVQIINPTEPVKQQKRRQDSTSDDQTPTKKQATTSTSTTPTRVTKLVEMMKQAKAQAALRRSGRSSLEITAASHQSGSPSLETSAQASSSQSRGVDSAMPKDTQALGPFFTQADGIELKNELMARLQQSDESSSKNMVALEQALGEALDKVLEEALEQALDKALEQALDKALEQALDKTLEQALEKALEQALEKTLEQALDKTLEQALEKALEQALEKALEQALEKAMNELK